ncbi:hypothetical protein [Lentzea sp. NPDC060358]
MIAMRAVVEVTGSYVELSGRMERDLFGRALADTATGARVVPGCCSGLEN